MGKLMQGKRNLLFCSVIFSGKFQAKVSFAIMVNTLIDSLTDLRGIPVL